MDITTMSVGELLFLILILSVMTFILAIFVWLRQKHMEQRIYNLHDENLQIEHEINALKKQSTLSYTKN
jgi:hypothetical protein